jgi:hypothetical protein
MKASTRSAADSLCLDLVKSLQAAVQGLAESIDRPDRGRVFLHEDAFARLQPLLRQSDTADLAAFLTDFGLELVQSVLNIVERHGPLHVEGTTMTITKPQTWRTIKRGLSEDFVEAAIKARLIPKHS